MTVRIYWTSPLLISLQTRFTLTKVEFSHFHCVNQLWNLSDGGTECMWFVCFLCELATESMSMQLLKDAPWTMNSSHNIRVWLGGSSPNNWRLQKLEMYKPKHLPVDQKRKAISVYLSQFLIRRKPINLKPHAMEHVSMCLIFQYRY